MCLIETRELAGAINLNEIVRGHFQSVYLGYYSFEHFAGEGYGCSSHPDALFLKSAPDRLGIRAARE